jgi:hypothetical protein
MTPIRMLSTDDKIAEIRRLYFGTTRQTIDADLAKALDLLKSLSTEEERERAAVYMDGLAQMRADWSRGQRKPAPPKAERTGEKRPGGRERQTKNKPPR